MYSFTFKFREIKSASLFQPVAVNLFSEHLKLAANQSISAPLAQNALLAEELSPYYIETENMIQTFSLFG